MARRPTGDGGSSHRTRDAVTGKLPGIPDIAAGCASTGPGKGTHADSAEVTVIAVTKT